MPLILIAGTGTEVGKTFVASAAARQLRHQSIAVVARKPVQSFASDDHETDADVLAVATGEQPHTVCPSHRWLPVPMAPPMAAHALGLPPFSIDDLATELEASMPAESAVVLVESAGGVRSPLADDGDTCDLASRLPPQLVVLVADADLGAINSVRLSHAAQVFQRMKCCLIGVTQIARVFLSFERQPTIILNLDAELSRRVKLGIKVRWLAADLGKKHTFKPAEVAGDAEGFLDRFNTVD